jgi:hypothetical protein
MGRWALTGEVEAPSADGAVAAGGAHGAVGDCYPAPEDVWEEDPDHPREPWAYEAANGDTNLGYWAWVEHRRESEEDDGD